MTRYALYYVPSADCSLARNGASWLGWDVNAGRAVPRREQVPEDWVRTPKTYGFHATLKPPFRLAEGETVLALTQAVEALAMSTMPVALGRLKLSEIGTFVALTAPQANNALGNLAARCVSDLDRFRAPLDDEELARRRGAGLDPTAEALLQRWGYPHVMERFRFHMTLTGRLDDVPRAQAMQLASAHFAADLQTDTLLDAVCLLQQPEPDAPFSVMARFGCADMPSKGARYGAV